MIGGDMSNFDFILKNGIFKTFAEASVEAEKSIAVANVSCTILCRRALELAVKWIYANDRELVLPYQNNLSSLVYDINFKSMINEKVFNGMTYIIKLGNFSVHSNKKVTRKEAVLCLKYLFDFMDWIAYYYDSNYVETKFDEGKLPGESSTNLKKEEREELENKLVEKDEKIEKILKENEELREKLTKQRTSKKIAYNFKVSDISEFETRKQFIDLDLKIAGWDSTNIREEVEVKGMPNTQEAGYVDYVLYGENGKPLAVVEAKRTSKDSKIGQQQAKLYADCLEKEYAQRPIIYYTNGKEIYMWDDLSYPERKVSGFYTQDELQLLIKRRDSKENLEHIYIANNIANRPYQLEAVKKVCESFEQKHRRALVVMATGTGKTRTAISLVDVLTSKNWVQNVLFLADRTELVKQAEKNFKKLLPDMSCCNLLSSKDGDPEESRIIFSTYQTMINCIDKMKSKNGITLFTPGHFDLIIIDEAHRSIYKKYQAIFDYFDGLLVGLTATPRDDVDKNTYKFFQLENNVPTFVYEYDEAVKQKYLVDYHTISTTTKFIERGIKYSELKEEDREEYENLFEEGEVQEEISSNAINSWLFNRDTIKIILETVMQKGLKVEGGDKLRKNYNIC
jgi:putative type I restriction-modification system, R subunit